jgi:ribosome-associated protein
MPDLSPDYSTPAAPNQLAYTGNLADHPDTLARICCDIASGKKAEDIQMLDLRGISTFTDYFVICSGTSEPQLRAIANELEDRLRKDHGVKALAVDGFPMSQWVIVDYGTVVVHLFQPEKRAMYDLERLWKDATRVDWENRGT